MLRKYLIQMKEETHCPTVKYNSNIMLEKSSGYQTLDGVLPTSCDSDSMKEVTSLASNDTGMSSHCFRSTNIESAGGEFCAEDPILSDKCDAINNNLYSYPLSHISQPDNDLSLFDNDGENKESSDLLYYGWPDLENFEDVDHMFRSCGSAFGIGSASNEEELSWFSSSHAFEGSEDVSKTGFKSSCSESMSLKNLSHNNNDASRPNNEFASNSYCRSSQTSDSEEPIALVDSPFVNGMAIISEYKDELPTKEQGNLHRKPSMHQKQPDRKRNNYHLDNGFSIHPAGNLKQAANVKLPYGDSPYQNLSFPGIQQQKHNIGPDTKKHAAYIQSNYSHISDQIALSPAITSMESEKDGRSMLSEEFSFASNQVESLKSSCDPSSKAAAMTTEQKREKPQQGLQSSFSNLMFQAACCDTNSSKKKIQPFETKDYRGTGGVNIDIPTKLDSSNLQESSCMSSVLNDFSPEETSFRQLLHVTEKLDLRTKLCIRDSLYRLARSAEQRHDCANMDCGSSNDRKSSEEFNTKTNECTGCMDMETDTNPIDRSIAHLLFHRPSDPSVKTVNDASDLKPHTLIHGAITSPPVVAGKLIGQGKSAAHADQELLITDKKQ